MWIALFVLIALAGTALLRLGWNAREPAQMRLTLSGWAAIGVALAGLAIRDGAWGIATASLPVMLLALGFLARAAMASRPAARVARAPAPEPTVHLHSDDWAGVGRRMGIFLLIVPVAGAISVLAGMAFAAIARAGGWGEADANVLALFTAPLLWSVLGVVLLLDSRLLGMLRPLTAIGVVSGALVWSLG